MQSPTPKDRSKNSTEVKKEAVKAMIMLVKTQKKVPKEWLIHTFVVETGYKFDTISGLVESLVKCNRLKEEGAYLVIDKSWRPVI